TNTTSINWGTAVANFSVQSSTVTTVISSATPAVFGQALTFKASVAASPSLGIPSGIVTFRDGNTALGTASLASGSATLTTAALAVASHSITVSYGGDINFLTSTST